MKSATFAPPGEEGPKPSVLTKLQLPILFFGVFALSTYLFVQAFDTPGAAGPLLFLAALAFPLVPGIVLSRFGKKAPLPDLKDFERFPLSGLYGAQLLVAFYPGLIIWAIMDFHLWGMGFLAPIPGFFATVAGLFSPAVLTRTEVFLGPREVVAVDGGSVEWRARWEEISRVKLYVNEGNVTVRFYRTPEDHYEVDEFFTSRGSLTDLVAALRRILKDKGTPILEDLLPDAKRGGAVEIRGK